MLGAIFVALGLAAAWGATSYSGAGGFYPMVLGFILASLGGLIALRALLQKVSAERVLIEAPIKFYTTLVVGVAYLVLVLPLGFYTASFLLMLALPFSLGFRRIPYALTVGASFIAIVYVIFSVLLERPLPRELVLSLVGLR